METSPLPRFEATQRREFLRRAAVIGALAVVPGLAACSKTDDKDAFGGASTTTGGASGGATSTTVASSTSGPADATTTTAAKSSGSLPDGAALEIAYTFAAGGGFGQGHNPFVAVWVETPGGDLVANVGVQYNPPKGNRWINNLSTWYNAVSSTSSDYLTTTTGATQPAGTHTLTWDGSNVDGDRAPQGDYVVFIESAQEHGNHSLTSAEITLGSSASKASLPDDGDLSAATATYSV